MPVFSFSLASMEATRPFPLAIMSRRRSTSGW